MKNLLPILFCFVVGYLISGIVFNEQPAFPEIQYSDLGFDLGVHEKTPTPQHTPSFEFEIDESNIDAFARQLEDEIAIEDIKSRLHRMVKKPKSFFDYPSKKKNDIRFSLDLF